MSMPTVPEHLAAILALVSRPLEPIDLRLADALGCVLTEPLIASFDLPRFDNSSMDGYAVHSADVQRTPVTLPVVDDLAATGRDGELAHLPAGCAARIMTGAQMPPGADAIVRVEWTDGNAEAVRIDQSVPAGQDLRRRGEDVISGDVVLPAGSTMGAAQLSLAAAFGRPTINVFRRPRVCVVSTGSELTEPAADVQLRAGAIFDSNSVALQALATRADADSVRLLAIPDDDLDFARAALTQAAQECDLLITTGGVSAGAYEIMKDVMLDERSVEFVKVAMQPGKPQGFGLFAGTPILTFPGNPVSAFVSFKLFAQPLIRKLAGHRNPTPDWRSATLAQPVTPRREVHMFPRAILDGSTNTVHFTGGSGSHLVGSLAQSNFLVNVPPGDQPLPVGTEVTGLTYN